MERTRNAQCARALTHARLDAVCAHAMRLARTQSDGKCAFKWMHVTHTSAVRTPQRTPQRTPLEHGTHARLARTQHDGWHTSTGATLLLAPMWQEQRCLTPTCTLMHATPHVHSRRVRARQAGLARAGPPVQIYIYTYICTYIYIYRYIYIYIYKQGSRAQDHLSKFMSQPPAGVSHVLVTVVIVFA